MLSMRFQFRALVFCILGFLLIGAMFPAFADEARYAPGEVLIKFKESATTTQRNGVLREMGATKIKEFEFIGASHHRLNGMTVEEALSRFRGHPHIEFIEPNVYFEPAEIPNDPLFPSWPLHNTLEPPYLPNIDIRAVHAWDIHRGSKTVIVGVIDSGVDIYHPDLEDNIYYNPGEIPGNNIDDDDNGYVDDFHGWNFWNNSPHPVDDSGHGTMCASIIGADTDNGIGVSGVCWEVSIMPLDVAAASADWPTSHIIEAIEYAISMDVDVLNMSFGTTEDLDLFSLACLQADAAGIYMACAAHNQSYDLDIYPRYPVCFEYDKIIGVTGTNVADDQVFNYGAISVDLGAPITGRVCEPGGGYTSLVGTSCSTPYISGVLALMIAKAGPESGIDFKARLLDMVDPLESLKDKCVSGGRVNAFLAIADPDYAAPATIRRVTVKEVASNWIELEWTATGDDGGDGTASEYEFRYATIPIRNTKQFEQAALIEPVPDPQQAGTKETFVIDGLEQGTTYYIAFRVFDEWGSYYYRLGGDYSDNVSGITKVKGFTTLGPPEIALDPTTIVAATEKWILNQLPFEIENNGVGTLDYEVVIPAEFPSITCYPTSGSIQPGDSRTVILFVGVDDFPCGENSAYVEVASNDESDPLVTLPLELTVSGDAKMAVDPAYINYGPVIVGSNEEALVFITNLGCESLPIMSLVLDNPDFSVTQLTLVPAEATIPVQVTFAPSSYGEIYGTLSINTFGDEGPETTVIQLSGEGVTPPEMVLVPTELSALVYTEAVHQETMTIYNNGGYQLNVILGYFGIPEWATLSTSVESIAPGDSLVVEVTFDARGYCNEDLAGILTIRSTDPENDVVEFPLSMTVLPASHITTSVNKLDWGTLLYYFKPITMMFDVQNIGCEGHTLTVTDLESSLPSMFEVVTATPFTVDPGESYEVAVKLLTSAPAGTHYEALTISSDDPDDPEIGVGLWVDIVPPPVMPVANAEGAREVVAEADEPVSLDMRAWPNPFNPSTEVRFNLDRPGSVELRIYDVRGALVNAIDRGYCSNGPVSIPWNGSNSRGSTVASGIYFYRVLSDGRQLGTTQKMVLLR